MDGIPTLGISCKLHLHLCPTLTIVYALEKQDTQRCHVFVWDTLYEVPPLMSLIMHDICCLCSALPPRQWTLNDEVPIAVWCHSGCVIPWRLPCLQEIMFWWSWHSATLAGCPVSLCMYACVRVCLWREHLWWYASRRCCLLTGSNCMRLIGHLITYN